MQDEAVRLPPCRTPLLLYDDMISRYTRGAGEMGMWVGHVALCRDVSACRICF